VNNTAKVIVITKATDDKIQNGYVFAGFNNLKPKRRKEFDVVVNNMQKCANVTVAPDKSKINVLANGTPHGLKTDNPTGGQTAPISILGAKLE